jgi:hypothetical protein
MAQKTRMGARRDDATAGVLDVHDPVALDAELAHANP